MSLVAHQQIAEQVARYCYASDSHDIEALLAVFAEEAVFEYHPAGQERPMVLAGHAALRAELTRQWMHAIGQTRHLPSGLLVDRMDANVARTRCMFLVTLAHEGKTRIVATGCYVDTWEHREPTWLLRLREVHLDVPVR